MEEIAEEIYDGLESSSDYESDSEDEEEEEILLLLESPENGDE